VVVRGLQALTGKYFRGVRPLQGGIGNPQGHMIPPGHCFHYIEPVV